MLINFIDPQRPDSSPTAHDLRSSAILLIDLDDNVVTTLTDRGPATSVIGGQLGNGECARRVWAARLRYWAEQFESDGDS